MSKELTPENDTYNYGMDWLEKYYIENEDMINKRIKSTNKQCFSTAVLITGTEPEMALFLLFLCMFDYRPDYSGEDDAANLLFTTIIFIAGVRSLYAPLAEKRHPGGCLFFYTDHNNII